MFKWSLLLLLMTLLGKFTSELCASCRIENVNSGNQLYCSNVTSLFLSQVNISDHNFKSLICVNCSIGTLSTDTIHVTLNHVTSLSLIKSHIKSIEDFAFSNFTYLRILKLYKNNIEILTPNSLKNITKLINLDLSNNGIKRVHDYSFFDLQNLDLLNLNDNKISRINSETFEGLSTLKYLYINNNYLKVLEDECFQHLYNLKILYLENNKILNINPKALINLHNLQYLYLNNNNINHLIPYNFKYLIGLIDLQMRNNSLVTITESSFNGLRNLMYLYLGSNSLKIIQSYGFVGLNSLQILDLSENKFEEYNFHHLSDLKNLSTVWYNGNYLNRFKIDFKADNLDTLKILGFSKNNLSVINYKLLFNKVPNISYIFIDNNPWKCEFLVNMYNYFRNNLVHICSSEYCSDALTQSYIESICDNITDIIIDSESDTNFSIGTSIFDTPNYFLLLLLNLVMFLKF